MHGADDPFVPAKDIAAFQEELRAGDLSSVEIDVRTQIAGGAMMLDVNMGAPLVDEADMLAKAIRLVQSLTDLPLCIDSSVVEALEVALAAAYPSAATSATTRIRFALP